MTYTLVPAGTTLQWSDGRSGTAEQIEFFRTTTTADVLRAIVRINDGRGEVYETPLDIRSVDLPAATRVAMALQRFVQRGGLEADEALRVIVTYSGNSILAVDLESAIDRKRGDTRTSVKTIGDRTHNANDPTDQGPGELFNVTLHFDERAGLYRHESSQPERFVPLPIVFSAQSHAEAKAKIDQATELNGHDCVLMHCADWSRPSQTR
jgi:hypothetical protein